MVVNPDPAWDTVYLAKIQAIEEQWAHPKGKEHICGFPTRNGEPCKRFPVEIGGKIVNGRCGIHGGYPKISNAVKAIVSKKVDFMQCDTCSISQEGRCDYYRKNQTCPIEAEMYQILWDNLNAIYKFDDFPSQVMLDSAIRDFIRRDRAWRLENAIGTMWSIKSGVSNYYERATEAIAKWFDRLGILRKKTDVKTLGEMMQAMRKLNDT
ncbi:MAG: hypothetical protein DRI44_04675 [Chlamydiae bacterium]|nr:MAG: hypothetical protein DRI44_04675 [Chlamydiota bacterium]